MFLTLKKWTVLYVLSLMVLLGIFAALLTRGMAIQASGNIAIGAGEIVYIIDPGHGGEDGGAVADDGTVESEINLGISLKMNDLAQLLGSRTVMTRSEDISIYDIGCTTLREKKVSDLKNRVNLCNTTENAVLISIHQNSLPQSKNVHGAQVFYNSVPESEVLAKAVQEALNKTVNSSAKTAKKIDSSVYLMKNVTCPAIIIECGFLSNSSETAMLKDDAYQKLLGFVILGAVIETTGNGT